MSIIGLMNAFLATAGLIFIFWKTGEWLAELLASQWCKRRRESRRQKAVNELYGAFELNRIEPGSTVRITTKGDLTIMMFRSEEKTND